MSRLLSKLGTNAAAIASNQAVQTIRGAAVPAFRTSLPQQIALLSLRQYSTMKELDVRLTPEQRKQQQAEQDALYYTNGSPYNFNYEQRISAEKLDKSSKPEEGDDKTQTHADKILAAKKAKEDKGIAFE